MKIFKVLKILSVQFFLKLFYYYRKELLKQQWTGVFQNYNFF